MLFISSKKFFSFLRYSNFCISILAFFSFYLEKEKMNNIETLCIDRVLNKVNFYNKHSKTIIQCKIFFYKNIF